MQTNQYDNDNSSFLLTDPNKFFSSSFYIIQLLPCSYSLDICFYWKENLFQKRLTVASVKYQTIYRQLISLIHFFAEYGTLQNLFPFFVFFILNDTTLCERQSWDIWEKFGCCKFNLLSCYLFNFFQNI